MNKVSVITESLVLLLGLFLFSYHPSISSHSRIWYDLDDCDKMEGLYEEDHLFRSDSSGASALYINSSDSAQAKEGVPVSDMGLFDAQEAILRLTEGGSHPGDGGRDLHPKAAISRQDFVILIVNALNLNTAERPEVATFKDVPDDHYAFSAIEGAVHAGLVKGIGNGRFGLGESLTRQDMAVLYQRALQGSTDKETLDGEATPGAGVT